MTHFRHLYFAAAAFAGMTALVALPTAAQDYYSHRQVCYRGDGDDAAGGAVAGAVVGGVAAGPVGAAVGAVVGGSAADDDHVHCRYESRARYYNDGYVRPSYRYRDDSYRDQDRYDDRQSDDRQSDGRSDYAQGYRDGYSDAEDRYGGGDQPYEPGYHPTNYDDSRRDYSDNGY